MRTKFFALGMVLMGLFLTSCDDTTEMIGGSLIGSSDKLNVAADTFDVQSNTILAEDIVTRAAKGYLGSMLDPETGSVVTGNYLTQFHVLNTYEMPAINSVKSRDADNNVIVDSCEVRLFYHTFDGDSLAQIKVNMLEMDKPVKEGTDYYSNFNPEAEGYIRTNGLSVNRTYTLSDQTEADSVKKKSDYTPNIVFKLNDPYTDKAGNVYNNFGTYLMRKYYESPTTFRNTYNFLHNICPGFYFKVIGGLGSIAQIQTAQITLYFQHQTDKGEVKTVTTSFASTEEVLQMTNFNMDSNQLQQLANSNDYTYLKTPAGLFTELSLPISNVLNGHTNDSINSAKIELFRVNNSVQSSYSIDIPQNIVMVAADSLDSFFAKNKIIDNKTSFLAQYNSSTNSYTFNNISGIVNLYAKSRTTALGNPNWGKVVLVPVEVGTRTNSDNQVIITKISHLMGLSSVKLVGKNNSQKIKMSVIYSKFNGR